MELELKYRVVGEWEEKLLKLGFVYKKSSHQADRYYLSGEVLGGYPLYLRLREDVKNGSYSFDFHEFIKQGVAKETEISLSQKSDLEKFDYVLKGLNLGLKCVVDKKRKVYAKDEFEVVLDEVKGLGRFVEIELEAEESAENFDKLHKMASSLGLKEKDLVIGKGYPELCMEADNGGK